MRIIKSGILAFVLMAAVGACFDPPEFGIIPSIVFKDVIFRDAPNPSHPDTLIISVTFKDGDGDLGVDPNETDPPFNNSWYFLLNPSTTCDVGVIPPCTLRSYIEPSDTANYVTYSSRRNLAGYDTLPLFTKPYNCINYEVVFNSQTQEVVDTFYYQLNPYRNNYMMDIFVKQNDASFIKYDWTDIFTFPLCVIDGADGRFPILAKDPDDLPDNVGPLEGTIKYKFKSAAFLATFSIKTLKLRIKIMDRSFNVSNTVESKEFTLLGIKK